MASSAAAFIFFIVNNITMWTIEINIPTQDNDYETWNIESEHPFIWHQGMAFYAERNGIVNVYAAKSVNQDFALKRYVVVAHLLGESQLPEHLKIRS